MLKIKNCYYKSFYDLIGQSKFSRKPKSLLTDSENSKNFIKIAFILLCFESKTSRKLTITLIVLMKKLTRKSNIPTRISLMYQVDQPVYLGRIQE